jgi:hypothetical protein
MKSNTKFKVGDKVNLKRPVLCGVGHEGFTIVTMDADGAKMTIYSKEWDDNGSGHSGEKRDLGTLMKSRTGHWNVDECEIELADSVTTQVSEKYPNEERPNEPVGSKHIVIISDGDFEVGEILTLTDNDGSTCPEFTNGNHTTYCDCGPDATSDAVNRQDDKGLGLYNDIVDEKGNIVGFVKINK